MELSDSLYTELVSLTDAGNTLLDEGDIDGAITLFEQALELVPAPKQQWEAATWIYAAIGDSLFFKEEYESSLNSFLDARKSAGGISNPFLLLRIGHCYLELNDPDNAGEYLQQALMLEGEDIFEEEEEKYLEFTYRCMREDSEGTDVGH